jgi:hypothetical protein
MVEANCMSDVTVRATIGQSFVQTTFCTLMKFPVEKTQGFGESDTEHEVHSLL